MTNPLPLLITYIKSSIEELRKVAWPTRVETVRYSLLVIGISLGLAVMIGILDYLFTLGIEALIGVTA